MPSSALPAKVELCVLPCALKRAAKSDRCVQLQSRAVGVAPARRQPALLQARAAGFQYWHTGVAGRALGQGMVTLAPSAPGPHTKVADRLPPQAREKCSARPEALRRSRKELPLALPSTVVSVYTGRVAWLRRRTGARGVAGLPSALVARSGAPLAARARVVGQVKL